MKEIFERIAGWEWGWFGWVIAEKEIDSNENGVLYLRWGELSKECSLADCLANHSWCKAVWGDSDHEWDIGDWKVRSCLAFQELQLEGPQACIDYILKTMA
jgi:hypothetical protein